MNPTMYFETDRPIFYWNGIADPVRHINFGEKYTDMDATKFWVKIETDHGRAHFVTSLQGIHIIKLVMEYSNMFVYAEATTVRAQYEYHNLGGGEVLVSDILPDRVVFVSNAGEELADVPHDYDEIVYADSLLWKQMRVLARERLWYIIRGVMLRYESVARSSFPKTMGARQKSCEK